MLPCFRYGKVAAPMKLYAPAFYPDFHCIANRCRHTCCAGWEIDIDPDALALYQSLPGAIGDRLRDNIDITKDGACFRLAENERCPMLNENGLCDLITACGEEALCQICADHPRFRSFFSDRTEIGLGLCCEAAARLTLFQRAPMRLILLEDDGVEDAPDPEEQALLDCRDQLFTMAQRRDVPLANRLRGIVGLVGLTPVTFDRHAVADFLLTLERLDEAWTALLLQLRDAPKVPLLAAEWDVPMEQLLCYLLYRHLPGALEDGLPQERTAMCLLLVEVVRQLLALQGGDEMEKLTEICRCMSAEIEYDAENVDALLAFLRGIC